MSCIRSLGQCVCRVSTMQEMVSGTGLTFFPWINTHTVSPFSLQIMFSAFAAWYRGLDHERIQPGKRANVERSNENSASLQQWCAPGVSRQKLWTDCALCFFFNSILSSLLPKGSGKMFVFMLHETRYIIHGVKEPEKLLGCWDMNTSESIANYVPAYGRVPSRTPPPSTPSVPPTHWDIRQNQTCQ